jgi:hypothetical protein
MYVQTDKNVVLYSAAPEVMDTVYDSIENVERKAVSVADLFTDTWGLFSTDIKGCFNRIRFF